jgi:hypothetical protein
LTAESLLFTLYMYKNFNGKDLRALDKQIRCDQLNYVLMKVVLC